jgi:hypothetical protein
LVFDAAASAQILLDEQAISASSGKAIRRVGIRESDTKR